MLPTLRVRVGIAVGVSLTVIGLCQAGVIGGSSTRARFRPGRVIPIPVGGLGLIAADGQAAWVEGSTGLVRIDARDDRVTRVAGTYGGDYPGVGDGVVWESCGQNADTPCFGQRILKIDPRTGAVLASIKVPGYPFWSTAGLDGVWVVVAGDRKEQGVARIDPGTGRVVSTYPVVAQEVGLGDHALWAAFPARYGRDRLFKMDPTTWRIENTFLVNPCDLLATHRAIWVDVCDLMGESRSLVRIDPGSGKIIYRVPLQVPTQAGNDDINGLAVAGGRLWASWWGDRSAVIEALDPATGKATGQRFTVTPPHPPELIGVGVHPVVHLVGGAGSLWVSGIDRRDVYRIPVS